jgi:FAD/FMN-containing dehydrogenase
VHGSATEPARIEALRAHAEALGGFAAIEDGPPEARAAWPPPGDLELARALKREFDPSAVLNPGRWAEDL